MRNAVSPHGGFFNEGTIIEGTHNQNALLKAFSKELARLLPFNSHGLVNEAMQGYETDDLSAETKDAILDDLAKELNAIAFAHGGYYFGAHSDDGADFGFWKIEADHD